MADGEGSRAADRADQTSKDKGFDMPGLVTLLFFINYERPMKKFCRQKNYTRMRSRYSDMSRDACYPTNLVDFYSSFNSLLGFLTGNIEPPENRLLEPVVIVIQCKDVSLPKHRE